MTVVRVLTMMGGQFDLRPEDGRRALPRVLELAAKHGLYVEVVALAGTADIPVDLKEHIDGIGKILAAHLNAVLEIANEPVHPSQSAEVQKPDVLRALAARVPSDIPVALGSIERGDGFGEGNFTWHSPRESGRAGWAHVQALAEGADLLARWKKPVISDEPIGAGPAFQPGRRDDPPARFRAAALLTRLVGLGATFHYEAGLQAPIPDGRELECFNAWNEAWTLLPAGVEHRGTFSSAGAANGIVATANRERAAGIYERVDGANGWVLVLGESSAAVTLSEGWSVRETREVDGGRLLSVTRSQAESVLGLDRVEHDLGEHLISMLARMEPVLADQRHRKLRIQVDQHRPLLRRHRLQVVVVLVRGKRSRRLSGHPAAAAAASRP